MVLWVLKWWKYQWDFLVDKISSRFLVACKSVYRISVSLVTCIWTLVMQTSYTFLSQGKVCFRFIFRYLSTEVFAEIAVTPTLERIYRKLITHICSSNFIILNCDFFCLASGICASLHELIQCVIFQYI